MPITIPREPDLVLVTWERNPLRPGSPRTITAARVIGSSRPCTALLATGSPLRAALACLKRNGFKIVVSKRTTNVSGYVLLQRG